MAKWLKPRLAQAKPRQTWADWDQIHRLWLVVIMVREFGGEEKKQARQAYHDASCMVKNTMWRMDERKNRLMDILTDGPTEEEESSISTKKKGVSNRLKRIRDAWTHLKGI